MKGVLSLVVVAALPSLAHPLITIRLNATSRPDDYARIVEINKRHAGSADEYWFGRGGAGPRLEILRERWLKQAAMKEVCEKAGIACGFQQGVTLGHGSIYSAAGGGQAKKDLHPFTDDAWQVDRDGKQMLMFCPRSQEVLRYEEEYAALLGATLKPVSLWLDDDLRLGFCKQDGCYCTNCLAQFNAQFKHAFTRAELVERLYGKGFKDVVRREWGVFLAESLALYGAAARRGTDRTNPACLVAYQSCDGISLRMGRDFNDILCALSGNGAHPTSIRIGSGCYTESCEDLVAKMRGVAFEAERVRRAGLRLSAVSYEQETYPRQVLHKTPEAIAVESALALANGCDALTEYYWDEGRPEPLWYYEEFAAQLAAWRPYFARLAEIARHTSLGGVARFIGSDFDLLNKDSLRSPTDAAWQYLGVPLTVQQAGGRVRYVDAATLDEWGEGDADRLLAADAVALVDAPCEARLRQLGGEKIAAAFAAGRLKAFRFASCDPARFPMHAERAALLDALDALPGAKLPVRFERTIPFFIYPRVDAAGRLVAVTFYNAAAGKALPTVVRLRNPAGRKVLWVRPEMSDVALKTDTTQPDEITVTIPTLPSRQVATLILP